MNWKERAKIGIKITTGDGVVYEPLYISPSRKVGFNTVPFEFNEIAGAYVPSGKVSYRIYPMVLIFQGKDHLDKANEFLKSAEDQRNWLIEHPYYDWIICRPVELNQDNTKDNVSIITGDVYETIEIYNPIKRNEIAELLNNLIKSFTETPKLATDLKSSAFITNASNKASNTIKSAAKTQDDLSSVTSKISQAERFLNNIGTEPVEYMNRLANVLRAPSRFYTSITNRLEILDNTFTDLKNAATGSLTIAQKSYTELTATLTLFTMAESCFLPVETIGAEQGIENPISENRTVRDVLDNIRFMNNKYDEYIELLDSMTTSHDNRLDSWHPRSRVLEYMKESFRGVAANLLRIAAESKQERSYVLPRDMAFTPLLFMLTGKIDNETRAEFIKTNSLELGELLIVKQARNVKYFV